MKERIKKVFKISPVHGEGLRIEETTRLRFPGLPSSNDTIWHEGIYQKWDQAERALAGFANAYSDLGWKVEVFSAGQRLVCTPPPEPILGEKVTLETHVDKHVYRNITQIEIGPEPKRNPQYQALWLRSSIHDYKQFCGLDIITHMDTEPETEIADEPSEQII